MLGRELTRNESLVEIHCEGINEGVQRGTRVGAVGGGGAQRAFGGKGNFVRSYKK